MANFCIGYINLADLATITANPVAGALTPVTYLQSDSRGDIFQATSAASQEIKLTWGGTAYTISQFTFWRLNLAFGDTIAPVYYPNADWTGSPLYNPGASAAYASGLFDNWGWSFVNRYHTPVAAVKSVKFTIAAAAAVQCARLGLFAYTEAPYNPDYGYTPGRDSNSKQNRSEGASLRTDRKGDWRTATFDMHVITEADYAAWDEIGRYCGTWGSFVASLYPGVGGSQERNNTIFGKFEQHPGQKIAEATYDFSMKILEL